MIPRHCWTLCPDDGPRVFFDLGGNVVVGTADETISFDPSLSELQIRSLAPIETEPTWLDTQQDRLERNRLPLALLLIAFVLPCRC